MALFNINPGAIGQQITATAAGKAAQAVAQSMSPKLVQDVQRVLKVGNIVGQTLGLKTGIGVLDNLFSLGDVSNTATPLLGGLTFKQAKAMHDQLKAARVQKKNLFFIRVTERNPPEGVYEPRPSTGGAGTLATEGLISSRIGAAISSLNAGIAGISNSISGAVNSAASAIGLGGLISTNSISAIALPTFDLLALDVSYGAALQSDHVQIGSGFMDRPTGTVPTEMQITTMDDEAGTLKRWFNGKLDQVARPDGLFGLPWEYLVTIEVVQAIPSPDVPDYKLAYTKSLRMRAQSIQGDLSRREQAVAEFQLVLSQFDSFMGL